MNRGWLRSGCFLYQPENHRTCCPNLAIRLDVAKYTPSKSQLRVLRRTAKYCRPVAPPSRSSKPSGRRARATAQPLSQHAAAAIATAHSTLAAAAAAATLGSMLVARLPGWTTASFQVRDQPAS